MAKWTVLMLCTALLLAGCGPGAAELRQRGIAEFQLGNEPQAKAYLQQVLDQHPSDPGALYYMGRIVHAEGAYEQAVYYYQCAIDADPSQADARKWLAKAQSDAGATGEILRFIP